MTFVMLFVVLVAAFLTMSLLLVLVTKKTREIGLLSALGGGTREIALCFCLQGVVIGVVPRHTRSPAKRDAVGSSRRSRQPPSNEGRSDNRTPNPRGPLGASVSEIATSRRTNPGVDETRVFFVSATGGSTGFGAAA
jgi:hypothetical protein